MIGKEQKILSTEDYITELNELVSLDAVKNEVNRLVSMMNEEAHRNKNGQPQIIDNYIFIGNPGTGKTTVGRLMSNIFQSMGVLPSANFVIVGIVDLISDYRGETQIKTGQAIDKAMGGVLFIEDVSYTFLKQYPLRQEALETLLNRMENDRGKFVVIAAGYSKYMNRFLDENPGFKRRCKTIIFEDFTPVELEKIFRNHVNKNGFKLSLDLDQALPTLITDLYNDRDTENFGNAREMRMLFEKARYNQSTRMAKQMIDSDVSDEEMVIFEKEDLL